MTEPPADEHGDSRALSADGRWWWNGSMWVSLPADAEETEEQDAPTPAWAGLLRPPVLLGCLGLFLLGGLVLVLIGFLLGRAGNPGPAASPQVTAVGTGPSQNTGRAAADAACNALGAQGLTVDQWKAATPETAAITPRQFATDLYLKLLVACPALLKDPGVRTYLQAQGVNPDA